MHSKMLFKYSKILKNVMYLHVIVCVNVLLAPEVLSQLVVSVYYV